MAKNYFGKIGITMLAAIQLVAVGWYIHHDLAQAYVRYGPAAQLNAGDIKSLHILDGTILSADMANYNSLLLASSTIGSLTATSSLSLPTGSITSAMILNGDIADADIATAGAIGLHKIKAGGTQGLIFFSNGTNFATSSNLSFATSTNTATVTGSLAVTATTTFNSVAYKFPSADGSDGQALTTDNAGQLAWETINVSTFNSSITAGNDLTLGDALFIAATSSVATTTQWHGSGADCASFGAAIGGSEQLAQSITETDIIYSVSLFLKKGGAPTADVVLGLQADVAGMPSGTWLVSGTIPNASVPASYATSTAIMSAPYPINSATTYWLVASSTAPGDASNNFVVQCTSANPYSGGKAAQKNPTWAQVGVGEYEWPSSYNVTLTPGRVYKASAGKYQYSNGYSGFANATVSAGGAATVNFAGLQTGLSGLTAGIPYYLSNTFGAIASTAGTLSVKVGRPATTTSLMIFNGM